MLITYVKLCRWSRRTNTVAGTVSHTSCTVSTRKVQQKNLSSITIINLRSHVVQKQRD